MRKFNTSAFVGASSLKYIVVGMAAVLLAGCSDSMDRFADNGSFNHSNPSDVDPVYTASIKKPVMSQTSSAGYQAPQMFDNDSIEQSPIVQSPIAKAPIAKVPGTDYAASYAKTYRQAPPAAAAAVVAPAYKQPKLAYNAPVDSEPNYKAPKLEENVQPAEGEKAQPVKPFKKKKGPKITVAEGMSLYDIAKANKITVKQLADANGLQAPYTVSPGTELVVPGTSKPVLPKVAALKVAAPAAAPAPAIEDTADAAPVGSGKEHVVAKGDTLFSLGRKLKIPVKGETIAKASPKDAGKVDLAETPAKNLKTTKAAAPKEVADSAVPEEPAAEPKQTAETKQAPAAATPSDAQLALRWPVRGRVISAYGSKPNGMKNEGINIMAPQGTKIQAADAGVVAYAGNELKGYGNLVLIRHAGGYVTAYAHAASLLVKKGDNVKRGDVIATVGQTGAVQSPQLHFEVRKGATAMDPSTFLHSATASN